MRTRFQAVRREARRWQPIAMGWLAAAGLILLVAWLEGMV